jgi:hypothetical protein
VPLGQKLPERNHGFVYISVFVQRSSTSLTRLAWVRSVPVMVGRVIVKKTEDSRKNAEGISLLRIWMHARIRLTLLCSARVSPRAHYCATRSCPLCKSPRISNFHHDVRSYYQCQICELVSVGPADVLSIEEQKLR